LKTSSKLRIEEDIDLTLNLCLEIGKERRRKGIKNYQGCAGNVKEGDVAYDVFSKMK
jgi:hypothetical protein